jgi:hypothetical protein
MMHEMTGHALTVFMGFFAIMNPVANTPIFLGLTADDPPDIRRRVAAKALLHTFALIVIFSLLGKVIFDSYRSAGALSFADQFNMALGANLEHVIFIGPDVDVGFTIFGAMRVAEHIITCVQVE